jgi:nucleotide-binding universal stress UspA family protein
LVGLTREAERLLVACRETRAWCDEALPQRLPGLHLAVRTGELVSETVRRAHELQADLIVVPPMTGRSGSIVAALARTSGVPVLVARPTDARRSLLAAADLEDETYPVLRRAAELAGEMAAEVLLLHDLHEAPARESSPAPSKAAAALSDPAEVQRQRLLRAAHRWLPRGKVVVTRENDAAHAIVKQATSSGVDTIIVGARPRPWLARRMAQTIAAQVVERAACSVLVVPIDGAEPAHLPSANVVPAE